MDGSFPKEIQAELERGTANWEQRFDMSSQIENCYANNKNSLDGFERCFSGVQQKAEKATARLASSGMYLNLRLQECLKTSSTKDCATLARNILADIDSGF
jgi:hypothetical protein